MTDTEPSAPTAESPKRATRAVVAALAALVVAVAGIVVAVAAGGDDDASRDPIELLSATPDAVRDAGTARIEMTIEMGGEGVSVDVGGSGVTDFATGDTSFEMGMMGMSFEMRIVDGTMYMRLPDAGRPEGMTTEWVAMPAGTPAQPTFAGPTSMTGFLDALRGIGSEIEELGEAEVNGVRARGFRVVVDVEQAIASVPEAQRADAREGLDALEAMGMSELPMEVWVTDDAIPVRMVVDMDASMFQMRMTIDLTDFGVDADIQAPPESEVTRVEDQAELDELMTGGLEYTDRAEAA